MSDAQKKKRESFAALYAKKQLKRRAQRFVGLGKPRRKRKGW